ncbi:MAG: hypothetical protein PHQ04_06135 [Opitutaceae bacterium]|nr:hypothetical protein [Opitutaceae bacterium]
MSPIPLTLWTYALSIVFAMSVAAVIHGLGYFVKALRLDRNEAPPDASVPTADTEREQQALAVAIAVTHHAKRRPQS